MVEKQEPMENNLLPGWILGSKDGIENEVRNSMRWVIFKLKGIGH